MPERCRRCSGAWRVRRPNKYRYTQSGLDDLYLLGGVEIGKCSKCGFGLVTVSREQQLLQVIAVTLLSKSLGLSGKELRFLRKACGYTQAALAERLGIRRASVVDRETGAVSMTTEAEFYFRAVILDAFIGYLTENKDRNFLTGPQMKRLSGLQKSLAKLPWRTSKCDRVAIVPSRSGWKLPEAA